MTAPSRGRLAGSARTAGGLQRAAGRFRNEARLLTGSDASRLYLALVLPMLVALNMVFVPFHAPDDYDHVKRAYAIGHGAWWPVTQAGKMSGGYVDASLARMIEQQKPAIFDWPRTGPLVPKRSPDGASALIGSLRWSGDMVFSEFPGSASYLPIAYLPQSVALRLGEALSLSVEHSVLLARLCNGVGAALVIAAALVRLPFGVGSVLLVLFLPKTLVQFASNSIDPVLHALTLAVLAVASRSLLEGRLLGLRHLLFFAACIVTLAGARPPMAALVLLPLWLAWRRRDLFSALALVAAVVVAAGWFVAVMPMIVDTRCGATGTLGAKFLDFLTQGPLLIARTLWWFKQYYAASFVGELGWGDGPHARMEWLPAWIYLCAIVAAVVAVARDLSEPVVPPPGWRAVLVLAAAGIALAIFFVMYLGCSQPQSPVIMGVQGRYFVACAFLCASALPGLVRPSVGVHDLYRGVLALFALSGFGLLMSEGLRIYWTR